MPSCQGALPSLDEGTPARAAADEVAARAEEAAGRFETLHARMNEHKASVGVVVDMVKALRRAEAARDRTALIDEAS